MKIISKMVISLPNLCAFCPVFQITHFKKQSLNMFCSRTVTIGRYPKFPHKKLSFSFKIAQKCHLNHSISLKFIILRVKILTAKLSIVS